MRNIFIASSFLLSVSVLTACSNDGFLEVVEEKKITHHVGEELPMSMQASQHYAWNEKILTLATNGESATAKYEALEQFATQYVTSAEELAHFTEDIISDYEAHTYLQHPTEHKEMLKRIFQAFIVERSATAHLKDFARAYYVNITNVYMAKLTPEHDIIQQNETVMAYMLAQYEQ